MAYGKPWLYRCSDGLHTLVWQGLKGEGFPAKRRPCDQLRTVWRPQRGRVEEPCTGVMIRQGWQVRDYVLNRRGALR